MGNVDLRAKSHTAVGLPAAPIKPPSGSPTMTRPGVAAVSSSYERGGSGAPKVPPAPRDSAVYPATGFSTVSATVPLGKASAASTAVLSRITQTAQDLVRIPSVGGVDSPMEICAGVAAKARAIGLVPEILRDGANRPVGVVVEIVGAQPGPTYALNAVVDTAPVGDRASWQRAPLTGEVVGEQLYGRGAADSKVAAAIFLEVGRDLARQTQRMRGRTVLFFDAAEHTGQFEGVQAFIQRFPKTTGVMIGYSGDRVLYVGSRGFSRHQVVVEPQTPGDPRAFVAAIHGLARRPLPVERSADFPLRPKLTLTAATSGDRRLMPKGARSYEIEVTGKAEHSGASGEPQANALLKTATLLDRLSWMTREAGATLIVEGLDGGFAFSQVPDSIRLRVNVSGGDARSIGELVQAQMTAVDALYGGGRPSSLLLRADAPASALVSLTLNVDVRTTPLFGGQWASSHVEAASAAVRERAVATVSPTYVQAQPPFLLARGDPMRKALEAAVTDDGARSIPSRVSGPSNVGNFLEARGIAASAGFGPAGKGVHGPNESVDLRSVPRVYEAYRRAIGILMGLDTQATSGR